MQALDVIGDPVRRRILELLADSEHSAGEVVTAIDREFGITQSAVSQHLGVLREGGFVDVRAEGRRRLYTLKPDAIREVDAWLERFRGLWTQRLDALAGEVERGKSERLVAGEITYTET